MIKAGLTGGYATGKTFVAAELARAGCHLIYADRLGHRVLAPGGAAYAPTVEAFGPGILRDDGTIDRKQLATVVFSSPAALSQLNGFVHPAVFQLEEQLLTRFAAADPHGIAIVEAAILIETGRYREFDYLILTACAPELQIARGMARDGLSREQVLRRLENQMPLAEKKRYADYVIETGGSEADTLTQTQAVLRGLCRVAGEEDPQKEPA